MRRAFLLAASAVTLASCAAGPAPDIATPVPELPATFAFAPPPAAESALASLLPADDPAYSTMAELALAASPRLEEAAARIEQARAGADRAAADRLPSIAAGGSATGTRTNPSQFSTAFPANISIDTERVAYAANVTARWDPDIFGVLRAQERSALSRVESADAAAQAIRIALLSEIAATVIDWRTLQARDAALRSDLTSAERLAALSASRERAGIAPGFDRVRAESAAASSRSRLEALASERARLVGRLVTLSAKDAARVQQALAQGGQAPALPGAPASLPSQLLTNRPDVVAAAADLAAEDAALAATARRRFPALDLSAAIGLLAYGLGNLVDTDSLVGSLAASVAAPLLDFGRIQAEIDGAAAAKKAAFARYRGAVFTALGDAEAGYGLVAAADREAEAAAQEAQSLARAARLAETRYRAGLADFLAVLDSRRAADASGERAAAAVGRARRARVLLWQALGGS